MNNENIRTVKQKKTAGSWIKGQSGNPNGRPRKPEIEELRKALKEIEAVKGKSLIKHLVERAYTSDAVLIALAKKLIPDLSSVSSDLNMKGFTLCVIHSPELPEGQTKPVINQYANLALPEIEPNDNK